MDKITERAKMIACMEYVARQINDENVFDSWLMCGVADGDIEYGNLNPNDVEDYYTDDKTFEEIMSCFLRCMKRAYDSGGLYCAEIVCKDKNDYLKGE